MTLEQMSVIEIKALVFDHSENIAQSERAIKACRQRLLQLQEEQKNAAKTKEAGSQKN